MKTTLRRATQLILTFAIIPMAANAQECTNCAPEYIPPAPPACAVPSGPVCQGCRHCQPSCYPNQNLLPAAAQSRKSPEPQKAPAPQQFLVRQSFLQPSTSMVPRTVMVPQMVMVPRTVMVPQTSYTRRNFLMRASGNQVLANNLNIANFPSLSRNQDDGQRSPSAARGQSSDDCCKDLEKKFDALDKRLRAVEALLRNRFPGELK